MKNKKKIISIAGVGMIGLFILGSVYVDAKSKFVVDSVEVIDDQRFIAPPTSDKEEECSGKAVTIEYGDNWFCGDLNDSNTHKANIKEKFTNNTLDGEFDYAYAQLFVRNDSEFADEVGGIVASKYDKEQGVFDGSKLDNDFIYQLQLLVDIADVKSEGDIVIEGGVDNLAEYITSFYN